MSFWALHRNVKIRLVEQLVTSLVANAVFPFMVIYFATKFGAAATGIAFTCNIIVGFVAGFYGGQIADRFGRRLIMLRAEYVRFVASLVMAVASMPRFESPVIVFAMMTVNAACAGLSRPAGEAMIIDVSTAENRKFVYTLDYWFWNISLLLGSIVGGFFFKTYRFELLLVVAGLSLVSVTLLRFFIVETHKPAASGQSGRSMGFVREMVRNYRTVARDRVFKLYLLAMLLQMAIQFQSNNYVAVRLAREMATQTLVSYGRITFMVDGLRMFGLLNSVNTVLVVAMGISVTKLVRKWKDRTALALGIFLYTAGYSVIAFCNQPWLLLGMMGIVTVGELMSVPGAQALLADIVPDSQRGSYMAINALMVRGAQMMGAMAVTVGSFLSSYAMGVEFLVTGLLSILIFARVLDSRARRTALADIALQTS